MRDVSAVAAAFRTAPGFGSSPLYSHLLAVVAQDQFLLELAARTRIGQQPTFALFGAVHHLLLQGTPDPLADYYASVAGSHARPVDAATGPTFVRFCETHFARIAAILATRLVQTNHVQRALVLRLGLALVRRSTSAPVCVVEVGASAGLNLHAGSYAFTVGQATFGDRACPVRIQVEVPPTDLLPDLDQLPAIADVVGIDLDPPDLTDADDRAWLRALVWPENTRQATQLREAMNLVAANPPQVLRGNAIDVAPGVARALPPGLPRLVVHTATRIHVPAEDQPAFDAAIAAFGVDGPLLHLALEDDQRVSPSGRPGLGLTATDGAVSRTIAVADGHLAWLEPLAAINEVRLGS
ncbi:DUF2332 domain-containing protein [Micromonospora sp. NBC_01813]|uniref:DUF2332 domain-containing protein n=1 Tax=Micromonospora sp. NBC_01813 TaxID=2975988 RepID=UPI002DD94115|nr:DUF2332 domain-containing protein [Micromonospora sp. NBC_01813]WSA11130.1 DUF2332 domain-containing protein [Micromonospora sp. NBC_01813]